MAVILSQAAGGIIAIWILSWLVGKLPPFRTMETSLRIIYSGVGAYALAVVLAGFGNADGGPWNPREMWIAYLISLIIVVVLRTSFTAARERKKVAG